MLRKIKLFVFFIVLRTFLRQAKPIFKFKFMKCLTWLTHTFHTQYVVVGKFWGMETFGAFEVIHLLAISKCITQKGKVIPFGGYFPRNSVRYSKHCPQVALVNSCLDPTPVILKLQCFKQGEKGAGQECRCLEPPPISFD